jgi:hypothetical protein
MFGNNSSSFYFSRFKYKVQKTELCDYCNVENAVVDFYVQTPSYYRNKADGHYFMCSNECKTKFNNERTCNGCGYGYKLQMTDKGYSLCTDYAHDYSCYEKEVLFKRYSNGTSQCSFCETIEKDYKNVDIDENNHLNVCNKCWDTYKNIVLWEEEFVDGVKCCFCFTSENLEYISRFNLGDDYIIPMCNKCFGNYSLLITPNFENKQPPTMK